MEIKTFSEINEKYDFEIEKIVKTIKKEKARKVLLQFPEGLKPYSTIIVDELTRQISGVEFFIWLDSCFGACDIPIEAERLGTDLVIQFGHSPWNYTRKKAIKVIK